MRYCPQCTTALDLQQIAGRQRPHCSKCGYTYFEDPKVAVGVVATKEGRILLIQRNHEPKMGEWSFPSGFVDAGERVEEAAIREVREEAGVEVTLQGLLGVYSRSGERVIFIAYAGEVVGGEAMPGDEAIAVEYFEPHNMPAPAFPHDGQIVLDWLAFIDRLRS